MFCAGGTIGSARKPFVRTGYQTRTMMPRPFAKSLPNQSGCNLLKKIWVIQFFQDIETIALHFIHHMIPPGVQKNLILNAVNMSTSLIPPDLRICETFFTQLSLIGDMSFQSGNQEVIPHVDLDDVFTVIIHFGAPTIGGELLIYNGDSKNNVGQLMKTNNFVNGNIHMGCFTDVVHAVSHWHGIRGSFSLNVKRNMLDFFKSSENRCYYKTFQELNYPSTEHFTIN